MTEVRVCSLFSGMIVGRLILFLWTLSVCWLNGDGQFVPNKVIDDIDPITVTDAPSVSGILKVKEQVPVCKALHAERDGGDDGGVTTTEPSSSSGGDTTAKPSDDTTTAGTTQQSARRRRLNTNWRHRFRDPNDMYIQSVTLNPYNRDQLLMMISDHVYYIALQPGDDRIKIDFENNAVPTKEWDADPIYWVGSTNPDPIFINIYRANGSLWKHFFYRDQRQLLTMDLQLVPWDVWSGLSVDLYTVVSDMSPDEHAYMFTDQTDMGIVVQNLPASSSSKKLSEAKMAPEYQPFRFGDADNGNDTNNNGSVSVTNITVSAVSKSGEYYQLVDGSTQKPLFVELPLGYIRESNEGGAQVFLWQSDGHGSHQLIKFPYQPLPFSGPVVGEMVQWKDYIICLGNNTDNDGGMSLTTLLAIGIVLLVVYMLYQTGSGGGGGGGGKSGKDKGKGGKGSKGKKK